MTAPPTDLQRLLATEPDLVDRIFDYVVDLMPELRGIDGIDAARQAVRSEFAGTDVYIPKRQGERSRTAPDTVAEILRIFNGRNASEVARRLRISRATVYRVIKQAGPK